MPQEKAITILSFLFKDFFELCYLVVLIYTHKIKNRNSKQLLE